MSPKIIIHGGAWDIPMEFHKAHIQGVESAAIAGMDVLIKGGTAIDAVLKAVELLENDPTFDAGKGSFLNEKGVVEMDAMIMDGSDLSIGSVICVKTVKNPILLADKIRTKTDHCILAGEGAENFAFQNGLEIVKTEDLLVGRELELFQKINNSDKVITRDFFTKPDKMGTVGAVAIDNKGNIATATSTGGTPNKKQGRVGDSPIPGSGGYANKFAGVSTTGLGESIMKVMLAKTAVDGIEFNLKPQEAADRAIQKLQNEVQGLGGLIMIDRKGEAVFSYNTPYMARAIANENGLVLAKV